MSGLAFADGHPKIDTAKGWKSLLENKDLSNWKSKGKWSLDEEGVLSRQSGGDIWTVEEYGDFILDLEFKVTPKTNSGVAIRVSPSPDKNKVAWYHDGALEVQILSPNDNEKPTKHDCAAMYDMLEPSKVVQKKPGEWNRYTIVAKGSKIQVIFNDAQVIDMNLDDWPEAGKNPDGTPNKYQKPMKDFPSKGHILLQFHGDPVWFRNVYVKPLDKPKAEKAGEK
ncbi:MAG TPA: hypothetical protein DD670_21030 [Planctomycetaceae bacterium]|nr:hypothetical protein [Planctomycetaceae bacterium]